MSLPKVTILMPLYNAENYLHCAIESVLSQSFRDFEFVIINDGSTDSSREIVNFYSDNRIRFIDRKTNHGLVYTLNEGIAVAKGSLIARMDSDDINFPERIEEQVAFLENNQEVGIVGTSIECIGSKGQRIGVWEHPLDDLTIRWDLLFRTSFAHPTVMIRSHIIHEYNLRYSTSFYPSEDYDFWTRLLLHTKGANIRKPLYKYRIHKNNTSNTKAFKQYQNSTLVAFYHVQRTFPELEISLETMHNMRVMFVGGGTDKRIKGEDAKNLLALYLNLLERFSNNFPPLNSNELRHRAALSIALSVFRIPLTFFHFRLLSVAISMYPPLLYRYPFSLLKAALRKIIRFSDSVPTVNM
jgi:glycosyltransferase involved in cell wall biosynthesis